MGRNQRNPKSLLNPVTNTIAGGIMFGAFVGYLASAQQILQFQYELGDLFALYFGILALSVGLASFANFEISHEVFNGTLVYKCSIRHKLHLTSYVRRHVRI